MSGSFRFVGVTAILLAIVGCGGGSAPATPTTPTSPTTPTTPSQPVPPLTLVASSPASGAALKACNAAAVLDFSGNIDPTTAVAANITLTSGSISQSITLTVSDAQITATPTQALAPAVTYTLTASTGVKGSQGEVLASPASITFSCDGHWETAATIDSDDAGDATGARVAFDAAGNAITVWTQSDGTHNTIWSNRYSPATGWGTPAQVQSLTEEANAATIVLDASGNATVIWDASPDGVNTYIYASRYTAAGGWSTEVQISGPTFSQGTLDLAGDANGDVQAIWVQSDGAQANIWGAHYSVAGGWSAANLISNGAGNSKVARLAMDTAGNVLSVWAQNDGTQYNVWSNRYDAASGWGTAALIEPVDAGTATTPRVKVDSQGNGIAVWTQSDGTQSNIWSARYVVGSGWSTPVLIEPAEAGDAALPRLAINAGGDAIVVWIQSDGTRTNLWSNHYSVAGGWDTEVMVQPAVASSDVQEAWVDIDAHGNALTVWTLSDGISHSSIWTNRYRAGIGWGTGAPMEPTSTDNGESPMVAMDATGAALAVWDQVDAGRDNIWANRFDF